MATFQTWEDYCYPAPHDHVLRNKFGIRSRHELRRIEASAVAARQYELSVGRVSVPPTYDEAHLSALHRQLFQDVYEWAGLIRTVRMMKSSSREFATLEEIPRYLSDAHQIITTRNWAELSLPEVAQGAAEVLAHINQAHPFREGNGRTAKAFLDDVLRPTGWEIDYTSIAPWDWNHASEMSRPSPGQYRPDEKPLRPMLEEAVRERSAPSPAIEGLQRQVDELRRVMKSAAPQSTIRTSHHDPYRVDRDPGPPQIRR